MMGKRFLMIDFDHVFLAFRQETPNNKKYVDLNRELFRYWLLSNYNPARMSTLVGDRRFTLLRERYMNE